MSEYKCSHPAVAVGTAIQIVFEYPNWGCEHVADMYDCFDQTIDDPAPCDLNTLADLCEDVQKLKNEGFELEAIETELLKRCS